MHDFELATKWITRVLRVAQKDNDEVIRVRSLLHFIVFLNRNYLSICMAEKCQK